MHCIHMDSHFTSGYFQYLYYESHIYRIALTEHAMCLDSRINYIRISMQRTMAHVSVAMYFKCITPEDNRLHTEAKQHTKAAFPARLTDQNSEGA